MIFCIVVLGLGLVLPRAQRSVSAARDTKTGADTPVR
jgi:hypothetical protein